MTANPLPPIPPISATSGMAPAPGSTRFKPIDPVKVLREHLYLLVAAGVVGLVLGVGIWAILLNFAPEFTSKALFDVNATPTNPWVTSPDNGPGNSTVAERMIQTYALRISSNELVRQALQDPLARDTAWFKHQPDLADARQTFQSDVLTVTPVRNANVIQVTVTTGDKHDPQRLLRALINVYQNTLNLEAQQGTSNRNSVYVQARHQAETDIQQLNEQIKQFTIRNDLTSLESRTSKANTVYQQLATQQVALNLALDQARTALKGLKEQQAQGKVDVTPDVLQQIEALPTVLQISYRINTLKQNLNAAIAQYGPNYSLAKQLQSQLDAAMAEKKAEIDRQSRLYQAAQLEQANQGVQAIQGRIEALEPKVQEAAARMTDLNTKLQTYQGFQDQLKAAKERKQLAEEAIRNNTVLGQRQDAVPVQLSSGPTEAELTFPRPIVTVLGVLVLVLGGATGAVFLWELLDQRVKSPADVKLLPEVELLGVLPHVDEDPSNPEGMDRVVEKDPAGLMAEAFRQVRTSVLNKMDRRGYKTLMVVSGQPQCGASSVTHNLATSLAHNGRRVLIMDVNFRRPSQCRLSGMHNDAGLTDVLSGEASLEDMIVELDTGISILPSGKAAHTAPEVLEKPVFRDVLTQVESRYDLVLLDVPPALLTSEAQLLAKYVDAMAIIVRATTDKRGMIERMLRRLDGHRADVLGVILNGVRSSAGGYFRKNYRDFYRYRANGVASNGLARHGAVHANGNGAATQRAAVGNNHGNGNGNGEADDLLGELRESSADNDELV